MYLKTRAPTEAERFDVEPRQWLLVTFDRRSNRLRQTWIVDGTFGEAWQRMKNATEWPDTYGLLQLAYVSANRKGEGHGD